MSVEPPEDRVVPEHTVGRLQYKVILLREYQQPAVDSTTLRCREGGQPLSVGDAEILLTVDHQNRCAPL